MAEDRTKMTVEIFGSLYKLKGNSSSNYMKMVAAHVNEHMHLISKGFPRLDIPRIAVLAAVHMADEFFKIKTELEKSVNDKEAHTKLLEEYQKLKLEFTQIEEIFAAKEASVQSEARYQDLMSENARIEQLYQNERLELNKIRENYHELTKQVELLTKDNAELLEQKTVAETALYLAEVTHSEMLAAINAQTEALIAAAAQMDVDVQSQTEAARIINPPAAPSEIYNGQLAIDFTIEENQVTIRTNESHRTANLEEMTALQQKYAALEDEYSKLKTEFNEWIQLVDRDH